MSQIDLNSIVIIESLNKERLTGTELYNDIAKLYEYKYSSFSSILEKPKNRDEFFSILQTLGKQSEAKGLRPILHLEFHGDKNGFELQPSGDYIEWKELESPFRRLNIAMRNSLIITLGVCYGSNIQIITEIDKEVPYFGIISPDEKIYNNEIYNGYLDFYKSLLQYKNLNTAIKLIKKNPKFKIYGAERMFQFFEELWDKYRDENPDELKTEVLAEISRQGKVLTETEYSNLMITVEEADKREEEILLNSARNKFLMMDKFPELNQRFNKGKGDNA